MRTLILTLIFGLASAQSGYALVLQLEKGSLSSGKIFLDCQFDLVKDKCLLDTGATNSFVTNRPEFQNYVSIGKSFFKSASGIAVETDEIQIGLLQLGEVSLNLFTLARATNNSGSVIGMNALKNAFTLVFSKEPRIIFNSRLGTKPRNDLMVLDKGLLAVPIKIGKESTHALFDTGAALSTVSESYIKLHADQFEFVQDIPNGSDGNGFAVSLKLYRIKKIEVGSRIFKNQFVVSMDFDVVKRHISENIDMILGYNLITSANWSFNAQNKTWSNE